VFIHICVWDIIVLPPPLKPGFCCILGIVSHILLVICIFILSFIESHILCNHPVVFFCSTCAVNQSDSVGSLISTCERQLGFNIYIYSVPSELKNLLWARWQYRGGKLYYHVWIAYARHQEHMCNISAYKATNRQCH
jgi:hypothetical protein